MRQLTRDVIFILAVVLGSVAAAVGIGWLLCGCTPPDEGADGGDTDSETETETDSEPWWVGDGMGTWWTVDVIKDVEWATADAACKAIGDGWRLPTTFEFAQMTNGCQTFSAGSEEAMDCGSCAHDICLDLLDWDWIYWTINVPGGHDSSYGYRWAMNTTTWSLEPTPTWYGISARCVLEW